jgi:hypothetical protein
VRFDPPRFILAIILSLGIARSASAASCDFAYHEQVTKINIGAIGNLSRGNDNGNAVYVQTGSGQWIGLDDRWNLNEPAGRALAKVLLLAHVNYMPISTSRLAPEGGPCLGANVVSAWAHE